MSNTKGSLKREIIIDRLLKRERGYSIQELWEEVNRGLEIECFPTVSINTIRGDIQHIMNHYRVKIEVTKRGKKEIFRYEDPNSSIFKNVLTAGELQHLHSMMMSIRFIDPIQGTLMYKELSNRLSDMLDVDPASDPIVLYKKIPEKANCNRFKALYQHIRTQTPTTIVYTTDGGKSEQKILVHPYYILYDVPVYYLLCHDATNDVAAKIPISSILRMISSPETEFLPNKDFPLQDFYTKHLSRI